MPYTVKKTIETIKNTGNDLVVQVKGNQKKLFCETKIFVDEFEIVSKYKQKITQKHGRREQRKVEIIDVPYYLEKNLDRWRHIKCIAKVTRQRSTFKTKENIWKTAYKESYYLSTITLNAKEFCEIIQNHWKIENVNHYVRDVSLKEDSSRIRKNPGVFARVRSFVLNILRFNNVSNVSEERVLNGFNFKRIFEYNGFS